MANEAQRQIDVGQVVKDLEAAQKRYEDALEARAKARDLVRMFEKYLSPDERKRVGKLIAKTERGKGKPAATQAA